MHDVLAGMSYVSSKNIFHRDIAARNILVSESNSKLTVKVGDFGCHETSLCNFLKEEVEHWRMLIITQLIEKFQWNGLH